jgi:general stress protein 26
VLEEGVRQLAKGRNFAAFTTLLPGGHPMTHVMWVDCDDEHILINTETHRQKARNIRRDPRVTVTVWDAATPRSAARSSRPWAAPRPGPTSTSCR